jgi:molybdate transport system substrate-binding protein
MRPPDRIVDEIAVAADCGLTVVTGAPVNAYRFAIFILSADGQHALAAHGFVAPALPQ